LNRDLEQERDYPKKTNNKWGWISRGAKLTQRGGGKMVGGKRKVKHNVPGTQKG